MQGRQDEQFIDRMKNMTTEELKKADVLEKDQERLQKLMAQHDETKKSLIESKKEYQALKKDAEIEKNTYENLPADVRVQLEKEKVKDKQKI